MVKRLQPRSHLPHCLSEKNRRRLLADLQAKADAGDAAAAEALVRLSMVAEDLRSAG